MNQPLAILGLFAFTVTAFAQGDLIPPPGPPGPTMKTLDQVEARTIVNAANTPGDASSTFIISEPGSYYLAANLTGENGKDGIRIAVNDVTLDLNGFAMTGVPGARKGIVTGNVRNIAVHRGIVRNWGFTGLDLELASNSFVEQIRASNNGAGISVGYGCAITGCVAFENSSAGITDQGGASIGGCVAQGNGGNGFVDHFPGGSTFDQCVARANAGSGFSSAGGGAFRGCVARDSINGNGFSAGSDATVTGCTAIGNNSGISAVNSCTISHCTTTRNRDDGITVFNTCLILNNNASINGSDGNGDGIRTIEPGNRIDGNHTVSNNGRGIRATGGADFVVRNTSTGNSAGNYAPLSGPTIGPIGGTPSTATSPWANF